MVAAFKASGAALACLCSSDEVYAQEAEAAAKALREAGAKHIYLAGRPGEREAAFTAAGIGSFIFVGMRRGGDAEGGARGAGDPGGRAKPGERFGRVDAAQGSRLGS